MRLGIVEYADCAHSLAGHPKCGRLHGHTYRVEVTVSGEPSGGMLIDFADLKRAVRETLARYDHGNWNDVLEVPTVENICALLHRDLRERLPFAVSLRVYEGHGKWAEI